MMLNTIGFVTILLCCVGYYLSVKFYKKNKISASLLLIFLNGLLLRIYIASDHFLHAWDERYHALVAKHLMDNPLLPTLYKNPLLPYTYQNWTSNHIWLHKQPLSLWIMAGNIKMWGINEYAVRFPSIVCSSLGILLTYHICKHIFNNTKTALLAAFFCSINGFIIELCGGRQATDHPDILFLFFIQLAIFITIVFIRTRNKNYNMLIGVCLGAALLTKWLPALIVLPIWLLFVLDSKYFSVKEIVLQFLTICIIGTLLFLPWQLYIHYHFPMETRWEQAYNSRHFSEVLEGQYGAWHYYLDRMRIDYGELIYIPVGWIIYSYTKHKKNLRLLGVIFWFIMPVLFFSFAATKMQGYILVAAPALFIITAAFYTYLSEQVFPEKIKWLKQLILVLLIALPIRYTIERMKPFENNLSTPVWVESLKNWKGKSNSRAVLFGYKAPIEAMFYTEATVYEQIPNNRILDSLAQQHYAVFVADSKDLEQTTRMLKGITIVQLSQPE